MASLIQSNFSWTTKRSYLINQVLRHGHVEYLDVLIQKYHIFPENGYFTRSFQRLNLKQIKHIYTTYKLRPYYDALIWAIERCDKEIILWLTNEFGMRPYDWWLYFDLKHDQIEIWYWLLTLYNITPGVKTLNNSVSIWHKN